MIKSALGLLLLWQACVLAAQALGDATLDIYAPNSQSAFWGRFYVIENATRHAGWIRSENGTAVYKITGIHAGEATRIKAILYAPGCALQTMDVAIVEPRNYDYSFRCLMLPKTEVEGYVTNNVNNNDKFIIEAKYVASWVPSFFGFDDGTTTEVPLETLTTLNTGNRLVLQIPDLSKDKLAADADHAGEIRFYLLDRSTGRIIDQLRTQSGRFGGLPVSALNKTSPDLKFCGTGFLLSRDHDQYGFANRTDSPYSCTQKSLDPSSKLLPAK